MIIDSDEWLTNAGFDDTAIMCLNEVWADARVSLLLDLETRTMRGLNFSLAETLDAVRHKLDAITATMYYSNDFTAHQASLIEGNEHADDNLWASGSQGVDVLLKGDLPRAYVIDILLISSDRSEVDDFIRRYRAAEAGTPETHNGTSDGTPEDLANRIALLTAYRDPPIPGCCR